MNGYFPTVWALYAKEMKLEARTKETVTSVLVFALIVAFIFNFAFDPTPQIVTLVGPGIVWVAYVFTGVLALNRSFVLEHDRGTLEGLLLSPASREALFAGKMLGILTIMLVVEALMVPVFLVLYDLSFFTVWFAVTALLATIGLAAVGTLFSAIAVHTRAREVLLPLLFLPVVLPVIIAAVSSASLSLEGAGWSEIGEWFQLLLAFDILFLVLSSWAFDFVLEE